MIYKCTNESCNLYNQEKNETIHYSYTQKGIIDNKLHCPECGKEREVKNNDNGYCRTVIGRPNVPTK